MSLTVEQIKERIALIEKDLETVKKQGEMLMQQGNQLTGHLHAMQWALEQAEKEDGEVNIETAECTSEEGVCASE